jgi:lipopolysaccharide transport system ATP-binding protein
LSTAIRFDHVSKRFTLHHQRPRSFQDLVIQLFKRNGEVLAWQPETVPVVEGRGREEFWALRDVSFSLEDGETLGIIGPNGAGKSTALKLIAGIIQPDSGEIAVNGRVGALLELGTGFHPDLSGLENIYLNGSILGLSRAEIDRKLADITAFAELWQFIDMPVKHYSSGMRMRLGFSIAAHIDPDVLLIDEVLAVGDENFQHKCLDRIMEMRRQGVTICFVSHGLGSVARLCSRGIWLNHGSVQAQGDVDDVISAYRRYAADEEESRMSLLASPLQTGEGMQSGQTEQVVRPDELQIVDVSFVGAEGEERHVFRVNDPWSIRIRYRTAQRIQHPVFSFTIRRNDGLCVSAARSVALDIPFIEGEGELLYTVDQLPLMEGTYLVSVSAHDGAHRLTCEDDPFHTFKVRQVGEGERYGLASLGGSWDWVAGEADLVTTSAFGNGRDPRAVTEARSETNQRWGKGEVDVFQVSFLDAAGIERRVFESGEPWTVRLRYQSHRRIEEPVFGLAVHREDGAHICGPNTYFGGLEIPSVEGRGEVSYRVDHLPLVEGGYSLSVSAHNRADTVMYDFHDRLHPFKVCQFGRSVEEGAITLMGEWIWVDRGTERFPSIPSSSL